MSKKNESSTTSPGSDETPSTSPSIDPEAESGESHPSPPTTQEDGSPTSDPEDAPSPLEPSQTPDSHPTEPTSSPESTPSTSDGDDASSTSGPPPSDPVKTVLLDLDENQLAAFARLYQETYARGYREAEPPVTVNGIKAGDRVRAKSIQTAEAFERGTGTVLAVMHNPDSQWEKQWGQPDIEVLVLEDRPLIDLLPVAGYTDYALEPFVPMVDVHAETDTADYESDAGGHVTLYESIPELATPPCVICKHFVDSEQHRQQCVLPTLDRIEAKYTPTTKDKDTES